MNHEPQWLIGVDGGATKTHVVVLDAAGQRVGEAFGPAATLNGRASSCWNTIGHTLDQVKAGLAGELTSARVVVGIAGTEIAGARKQFVSTAPTCAALTVVSDAHIACAGAHDLADGAIVAVGTGVVGLCRVQGTVRRAGGWGFPHDDQGSGAWLGMQAVAHALAAADGRVAADDLSSLLLADFHHEPEQLASWACQAKAGDFARYARLVADRAQAGVHRAESLLNEAAAHVATVASALISPDSAWPLALTGGLGEVLAPRLPPVWQAHLVAARCSAAYGAARMAGRREGNGDES